MENSIFYLSILIFIIIFSSISLEYKIKEFFDIISYQYKEIISKNNRRFQINSNHNKLKNNHQNIKNIKEFKKKNDRKIKNILLKNNINIHNEKKINKVSSFKYGEDLFLSTYHYGGHILDIADGNKFSNKKKEIYKKIRIISTTGKKEEESIKYGDLIQITGLTNDIFRIKGGILQNTIFPNNYFYLQNINKQKKNLQISLCKNSGKIFNFCEKHKCANNKSIKNPFWRHIKKICRKSCNCPIKRERKEAISLNKNTGPYERMKFIRK
tara:strand:+ start:88 stop:894 length:807 start_codon:yes stop_codon:yes gene_type:complete